VMSVMVGIFSAEDGGSCGFSKRLAGVASLSERCQNEVVER
jgi:hypothetical protein